MPILKDLKLENIIYQKVLSKIITLLSMVKNFYEQAVDSDIKRYEEIRTLTTGQDEDYTTGCLLDYEYIKNHCKLIAVDLNRQNKLDADPKAIQQIEYVGQLKRLIAKMLMPHNLWLF